MPPNEFEKAYEKVQNGIKYKLIAYTIIHDVFYNILK